MGDLSLATLANLAEIIGAGSIVTGLVFKRIAPLDLVLDLAGGIVSVMCQKLRPWLNELRAQQSQPSWGEWFEWLGDRALELKPSKQPAHIGYRAWKP